MKQRTKAIAKLAAFGGTVAPSSGHIHSFRAREKMSKKTYQAVMVRTKFFFAERYGKKSHCLKTDVTDTFKAIVVVTRYEKALTEKIDALVEELGNEYNSEPWNKMIHDKRLKFDSSKQSNLPRSTMQWSPMEARGKAKAKAKAGRGAAQTAQDRKQVLQSPPTPLIGQLPNFHLIEVPHFKGPWSVICGQMKAEATVSADGTFDMHERYRRGWPGGWSSLRCQILADYQERTFLAKIDSSPWKMVEALMDAQGKSVVVWASEGMPQSIWTRTKKAGSPDPPPAAVSVKPKAKAKTQVRKALQANTPPDHPMHAETGGSTLSSAGVPGSPTPSPAEWYTEIRDGRLMWTDGISAVPAEERVTDDNRQKTKMQF